MTKEKKTRNFDFLKNTLPELPSREEVIQKTVELTGQASLDMLTPSVSMVTETLKPVPKKEEIVNKELKKTKRTPKQYPKAITIVVEQEPKEKSKVGRRALEDSRKPFTSTITVENKRRLRQLCAEYDIAMSDALNEMLAAQFEKREPKYKV